MRLPERALLLVALAAVFGLTACSSVQIPTKKNRLQIDNEAAATGNSAGPCASRDR